MTEPPKRSIARRVASRLRFIVERAFDSARHVTRRSQSIQKIREGKKPRVILFICYGNICRSSYAEFSAERHFAARPGEQIRILSAGYYGPDRSAPANAIDAAHELGVDLRPHRSKLLTPELIADADLIIGMEKVHRDRLVEFNAASARFILLGTLDSSPFVPAHIDDPYGHSREVFVQTYRRIDRCLANLVRALDDNGATR